MKEEIKAKVDKSDFEELLRRYNQFSDIESIQKLEKQYLPRIAAFALNIDQFYEQDRITKECIRKFDESLSIKVNKGAFLEFQHDLDKRFVQLKDWKNMKKKMDKVANEAQYRDVKIGIQIEEYKLRIENIVAASISD